MYRNLKQYGLFWKLQLCWIIKHKEMGSREAEREMDVRGRPTCLGKDLGRLPKRSLGCSIPNKDNTLDTMPL